LLLVNVLTLVFNAQLVRAEPGAIYIRADGSIDPSTAPISTIDNVTYTLTGDIQSDGDGIVVERSNIIIDGVGHIAQGTMIYDSRGIDLTGRGNVTIKNMTVEAFDSGIRLSSSSHNSLSGNNVAKNYYGIRLDNASNNILSGNNITANGFSGIWLYSSSINSVYHNNFVNNTQQVASFASINVWDDGYPSGGNYWSDYNGTDANHHGIGDTAYIIDANNRDHYPLMTPHIIPEFPSFLILPLFMIAALLAAIVYRKKRFAGARCEITSPRMSFQLFWPDFSHFSPNVEKMISEAEYARIGACPQK
jgi:parallel beta-helix repeat protein